jgi:hypothetical protein
VDFADGSVGNRVATPFLAAGDSAEASADVPRDAEGGAAAKRIGNRPSVITLRTLHTFGMFRSTGEDQKSAAKLATILIGKRRRRDVARLSQLRSLLTPENAPIGQEASFPSACGE